MGVEDKRLPELSPPPREAPIYLKELYVRYLAFKQLLQQGRPRHALLSIREGLAAALRQLTYSLELAVDATGMMPGDPSAEIGVYTTLLLRMGAIDRNDSDQIRLTASIIGRHLQRGGPTSSELIQITELYVRVYNSLLKKFEEKFRDTPSYIG